MAINLRDRRELSNYLEELSLITGNGTSLISLYIPATSGQQQRANDLIKKEITLCQSIKDRSVRNAVKVRKKIHIYIIANFRNKFLSFLHRMH